MSRENAVKKLLNLPLDYIDFNFYGHKVPKGAFSLVSLQVGSNIVVQDGPSSNWAFYQSNQAGPGGTIYLPKGGALNGVHRLALVLHECVHAYFDLQPKAMSLVANEGCAYIAQGLFLHRHGALFDSFSHPVDLMASYYLMTTGLASLVKGSKKPSSPGKDITRNFVHWLDSQILENGAKAYDIKQQAGG